MQPSPMTKELPADLRERLSLLIFDLDGVITSERRYWEATKATTVQLLESEAYLGLAGYFDLGAPGSTDLAALEAAIHDLKGRGINSNWDKTFLMAGLHLVGVLRRRLEADDAPAIRAAVGDGAAPLAGRLRALGGALGGRPCRSDVGAAALEEFLATNAALRGAALLDALRPFAARQPGGELLPLEHKGALWQLCYELFQGFYTGELAHPAFAAGPGGEETVLPAEAIAAALGSLAASGRYTLGVATGRPLDEVIGPLERAGLLRLFDPGRIVTIDDVFAAEAGLAGAFLGKPHPFSVLKAIDPGASAGALLERADAPGAHRHVAYVGDSPSDVVAARRAGCTSVAVLTGARRGEQDAAAAELAGLGCDAVIDSVLELPALLGCG
ncbi:MAG TPA: HAD hydrolase-like protein [Chloroflexaceae bacterium]|nr:HAD hydrolase-like protein [Chloroflexaceae bacterium]